jgi:Transmembrane secretion effector
MCPSKRSPIATSRYLSRRDSAFSPNLTVTLRQTVIPADQLARTVGAYRQVMYGSIPIGSALAGVLGVTAGTHAGVAAGTIGLALSALPMLIRRIRQLPTAAAAQSQTTRSS